MNNVKRNLEIACASFSLIFVIIAIYLLLISYNRGDEYKNVYLFYIFVNLALLIFSLLMLPTFKRGNKVLGKLGITIPTLALLSVNFIFFIFTGLKVVILLNVLSILFVSISLALKHENFDVQLYLENLRKRKSEINGFANERKFSVGLDNASEIVSCEYEEQLNEMKEHREVLYPNNQNYK